MLVKKLMPRSMRGFTLTEAAIVLGIVGLILGAIWVAAAAVYTNLRTSTTSNQLLQMVQSVRSLHATQNTVDAGLTGMATGSLQIAKAGGIPKDMLDNPTNPTKVRSVWGGDVEIAHATTDVTDDSFIITYKAIPPQACADLLTRNTGSGRDGGLSAAGAALPTITAFPISVTLAVTTCGALATSDLSFKFKLKS
ncbi:MAG: type 4 pilus major pilin [Bdellovibrionales bacterium]|jgi:hypothetical protein